MEHKHFTTTQLAFCGLAIVLNIVGAFIAVELKLPIFIDLIGTIFASVLIGPWAGATVGVLTNLFNGIFFDPYSFYYIPVQIVLGLMVGYLIKKPEYFNLKNILVIILTTLVTTIIASLITAFVFEGVTSGGDTFIIAAFKAAGLDLLQSVFTTEIIITLIDRFISFYIAFFLINIIPEKYKQNLKKIN